MLLSVSSALALCLTVSVLALGAAATGAPRQPGPQPRVAVVTGRDADDLERFAAQELCGYLDRLFGAKCEPTPKVPAAAEAVFFIGSPTTNAALKRAMRSADFPDVSDQGIVLRRPPASKRPALVVGGGSPRATLWAVYELVEWWGVRYLLHEDILPERRPFRMPDLDVVMEPELRVRQWRVVNDFACGPESWGMADYRPVLDQLAKLKFNRILISLWPWQPFLHWECKGIERRSAWLWFDYHYPITDDMVGRELFGDEEEFWNPDLPRGASYEEFVAAGERLIHELTAYAHSRGMECVLTTHVTEFPPEFAELLENWQKVHQLAELTVVPTADTPVEDPALAELATAVLTATVNTYKEADYIAVGMPEWRQWSEHYERAWSALDSKYGIEKTRPLAEVIAGAEKRVGYPGGPQRALAEVKGDIVALYFYDRLMNDLSALDGTARPDMKFVMMSVAEELFPVLSRVLPQGWEALNFVDYTASRVVRRREVLANVPSADIPCTLIYTLHDDNVGLLPQLATGSLHELTTDLRRHGWAGFSTRYWLTGDHDPCLAYLSRASWDERTTPDEVYREQIAAACGEGCVEDMLTVFREVEATTIALEDHGLGLTFPVPGMIMKHWTPTPIPEALKSDREGYRRALEAARKALGHASERGRPYVEYWIGRLEFGIGYLDTVEAVRLAAIAEADGNAEEAVAHARRAVGSARAALEAYAGAVKDRSDLGAIAVLNEYVYRPLCAKLRELEGG